MSLANLERISEGQPEVVNALVRMKEEVFRDSAMSAKNKFLIALALGCALKCNTCIESNARAAKDSGATKEEIREALSVALYMAGPTSVVWTAKIGEIIQ